MTTVCHRHRSVAFLLVGTAFLGFAASGASAELGDVVGLTLGPANTGTFGSAVHVMNGNRLVVPDRFNNIYVYDASRSLINTLTTPDPINLGWGFGFSTTPLGNLLLASDFLDPSVYNYAGFDVPQQQVQILNIDTGERVGSFVSPNSADDFGKSLSYHAGLSKVFIGAFRGDRTVLRDPEGLPFRNHTGGEVHAFDLNLDTGNYSLTTDVNPTPFIEQPSFGFSIANSRQTLVVGETHTDEGLSNFGLTPSVRPYVIAPTRELDGPYPVEVHLYDAPTGEYFRSIHSPNIGQGYMDLFGAQLATTDKTVYISATEDRSLGVGVGAVYAYDVFTGTMQHQFLPPVSHGPTLFGWATKVYGDYLFVGAPEFEGGSDFLGNPIWTDSGAVFIYNRHTGELIKTIENPTPNDGDNFGRAIEVVSTRLFVGAPFDDSGGGNAGAVHEFDLGNLPYSFNVAGGLDSASAEFLGGAFTPGGIDLTANNLNGAGDISGELVPGTLGDLTPFSPPDGNPAMWSLAFTGVADDFALTFGYDDTGLGPDEARLGLWQFLGLDPATDPTNWVLLGLADAGSNTITVQTDSLGTFALGVVPVPEPSTFMLITSGLLLGTRKTDRPQ